MSSPSCILLVEDDSEQAMLFSQALTLSGYSVHIVGNSAEALSYLAASSSTLLLADWDLPGMQGDALIAAVKAQFPAMKTVLYSNHALVEELCQASGADACFRKMDGIARLRKVIAEVLAST